ncbi:hypothetical protein D9M68_489950 [compost metagenome]
MITENHPFYFLEALFEKEDSIFSFSKYVYTPDALFDEREIIKIPSPELTADRISQEISLLNQNQELSINSNVSIKGRSYHIPMIDFALEEGLSNKIIDRMFDYLPKAIVLSMAFYHSGNSYHAYSTTLLSPKEWLEFMGRLLLINPRGGQQIIDSRWIGHRIIGGYSSLRWSNNSSIYKKPPSRVPYPWHR